MQLFGNLGVRVIGLSLALSAGLAMAETDPNKLSDSDRAKRDAEKVFSFIKFSTVRGATPAPKPAAAPAPTPAPVAAAPAPKPAATRSLVPAAPAPTSNSTLLAQANPANPANAEPPQVLEPAAPMPVETPTQANVAPVAVPEPVVEEVPLRLVEYVEPPMDRKFIEAMGGRPAIVPIRFTVQPNGVVSHAEPREGSANRRLGLIAARAVTQWRFAPLPAERVVDVELSFTVPKD